MKSKLNVFVLLLTILTLVFIIGCGKKNTEVKKDIKLPTKVTIGIVNSKAIPPQVVYGFNKDIYKKSFPQVDISYNISEGHHDVAMSMAEAKWDFMYLGSGPILEFTNYGFKENAPAKYTIIAGAQFGSSILLASPDIKTFADLDGKTVGITNKNNDKEMLLNKLLAKEKLKTESLGGTVKVIYGEPVELYKQLQNKKIEAIYPMPSAIDTFKKAGFKVLSDGTDSEYGKKLTTTVFAVSNKFLEEYPDFVKEMVKIHVNNTELALKNTEETVNLTYDMETKYFAKDPKRVVSKEELTSLYQRNRTTYEPNIKYLKDTYKFMEESKYKKALPSFNKWANFTMLNEVLKEKGEKPIK